MFIWFLKLQEQQQSEQSPQPLGRRDWCPPTLCEGRLGWAAAEAAVGRGPVSLVREAGMLPPAGSPALTAGQQHMVLAVPWWERQVPWRPEPGCPPSTGWRAKAASDLVGGSGSVSGVDSTLEGPEKSLGDCPSRTSVHPWGPGCGSCPSPSRLRAQQGACPLSARALSRRNVPSTGVH